MEHAANTVSLFLVPREIPPGGDAAWSCSYHGPRPATVMAMETRRNGPGTELDLQDIEYSRITRGLSAAVERMLLDIR